jgi:hypothetical protein
MFHPLEAKYNQEELVYCLPHLPLFNTMVNEFYYRVKVSRQFCIQEEICKVHTWYVFGLIMNRSDHLEVVAVSYFSLTEEITC